MSEKSFSYLSVFPDGIRPTRVVVDLHSGNIESLLPESGPVEQSCLLFPGFVDIHVHAREFPKPATKDNELIKKWESTCDKEMFASAGDAALNGGVTCFAAMPNDPIPPDNKTTYDRKRLLVGQSRCPVILFAAVTERSEPWADLPYKLYLDSNPNQVTFSDWRKVQDALSRYKGNRLFFHAEDPEILRKNEGQTEHWEKRPPEAEVRAVAKILEFTHRYHLVTHICHVSTEGAVNLIREYNATASTKVTCEVTPHHLFFSVDQAGYRADGRKTDIPGYILNCNPPLRSEHHRQAMIEALRSGLIQTLASDHAPHSLAEKKLGVSGMPHLDTLGPFVGWLIKSCGFDPMLVAKILSEEPFRIITSNLNQKFGRLQKGDGASFTVIDFGQKTEVGHADGRAPNRRLFTRCGWSPFEYTSLPAYVRSTVINGVEFNCGQARCRRESD